VAPRFSPKQPSTQLPQGEVARKAEMSERNVDAPQQHDAITRPDHAAHELTLYHAWTSSAARRVRFCLAEKGLDYRGIALDLFNCEQHSPAYLAINPNGVVPTLVHDGAHIVESTVINEYLDSIFPGQALRPTDPSACARMRVWTKFIDEVLIRAIQVASWNYVIRPVAIAWDDQELERRLAQIPLPDRREDWRRMARQPFTAAEIALAIEQVLMALARMQRALRDHKWLVGDQISLADINMAPYAARIEEFEAHGVRLEDYPAVAGWWDQLRARPSFAAAGILPLSAVGISALFPPGDAEASPTQGTVSS